MSGEALQKADVHLLLCWMPILSVAFSVPPDDRAFCARLALCCRDQGFTPSAEEIARMRRIRDAYLSAQLSLGGGQ